MKLVAQIVFLLAIVPTFVMAEEEVSTTQPSTQSSTQPVMIKKMTAEILERLNRILENGTYSEFKRIPPMYKSELISEYAELRDQEYFKFAKQKKLMLRKERALDQIFAAAERRIERREKAAQMAKVALPNVTALVGERNVETVTDEIVSIGEGVAKSFSEFSYKLRKKSPSMFRDLKDFHKVDNTGL